MTKLKKIGKIAALSTVCALAASAFVGCGGKTVNEKPEIVGVGDFDCVINEPVDLLRRVAALDKEDGDITPAMKITVSPDVEVKDGIAVFPTDDEYEVTYSVSDSAGNSATATAYVSVYRRPVYKAFDSVNMNGFSVDVAGGAKLATQSVVGDGDKSHMLFEATGASNAGDVSLTRTYTLATGYEHTFTYVIKSNAAGTAKAKIGEEETDLTVVEGDNTLTFSYEVPKDDEEKTADVKVQLLLGSLGADIKCEFTNATVQYESMLDKTVEFGDNVKKRIDSPVVGSVDIADDNSSATLHITTPTNPNDDWKGGMFIETGIDLNVGSTYNISFDLESETDGDYSVRILRSQWGPDEFILDVENLDKNGSNEQEVTIEEGKSGKLWIYVQAGGAVNDITISNLKVTSEVMQTNTDTFGCYNVFKMFAYNGAPNYVEWKDGKLLFHVDEFGSSDWHNKIEGVDFTLGTSSFGDFYISFKAKASKPITARVIGPRSGAWDPNVVWAQFEIPTTETLFTFRSNAVNLPGTNHLEWQFGEVNYGLGIEDVTIEISDIVIYRKSIID
ncbi:MAG: hypothetical protein J1G04_01855 [Clostridiales bacterium]|nr:hypothetical protein [Clostridiales bacterium]